MSKEEEFGEEGARPSSLIPVHRPAIRDPLHDLQLLRDVAIINEQVRRELGSNSKNGNDSQNGHSSKEKDALKINLLVAAAVVGVGTVSVPATSDAFAHARSVMFDSGGKGPITHVSSSPVVPRRFSPYSSAQLSEGIECVVGAVADEDGMNTRPHAYLHDKGVMRWSKGLEMPSGFYQGRATHCLLKDGSMYVLVQVDTHSQQSLSQTLIQIVRLGYSDGSVEDAREVNIPDLHRAYSSWVSKGSENFRQIDDAIHITGRYRLLDSEDVQPFSVVVNM